MHANRDLQIVIHANCGYFNKAVTLTCSHLWFIASCGVFYVAVGYTFSRPVLDGTSTSKIIIMDHRSQSTVLITTERMETALKITPGQKMYKW